MSLLLLLLLIGSVPLCYSGCGVNKAVRLLRLPIPVRKGLEHDVVLEGLTNRWAQSAYNLQIVRMRLGEAWELAFTDYGFQQAPKGEGVDLINHERKIAIEVKNGYRVNSIVRRVNIERLRHFRNTNPDYTVILGYINWRTPTGRRLERDGVVLMAGRELLHHIFKGKEEDIIQRFRQAVRSLVNQ